MTDSSNPRLIRCSDCEKSVSRRAIICPNCGCPIELSQREEKETERDESSTKGSSESGANSSTTIPVSANRSSLPAGVYRAGMIWIVYGAFVVFLCVVVCLGIIYLEVKGSQYSFTVGVPCCGFIINLLIAIPFVYLRAIPSVRGRAKDTLGHGIFSLMFAVILLFWGVGEWLAGVDTKNEIAKRKRETEERRMHGELAFDFDWFPVEPRLYYLFGIIQVFSGVPIAFAGRLYLKNRKAYREWKIWQKADHDRLHA